MARPQVPTGVNDIIAHLLDDEHGNHSEAWYALGRYFKKKP